MANEAGTGFESKNHEKKAAIQIEIVVRSILSHIPGAFLGFESGGCSDCCCQLTHAQHDDMTSTTPYHLAVFAG